MSDLALLNLCPDLYIWKKDVNLAYVDINESAAQIFGFRNRESVLGKTDFDIPSKLSNSALTFREQDCKVMKEAKSFKFIEIQPCVNDLWKILYVVKSPYYENGSIKGVIGYAFDITKSYPKLEKFLLDQDLSKDFVNTNEIHKLTLRESECLFFLMRRCTSKEIARLLKLSPRTIEDYIEKLKNKLDCKSKFELIEKAKSYGYFDCIPSSIFQKQWSIFIE